jgi:selenocysteine lyase/cysteine desulfurase
MIQDAALGDRRLYPELQAVAYLAFAATAPVSELVRRRVAAVLDAYAREGNVAFLRWVEQREQLREKLARLVGAAARDVALISGTTSGIRDLALSLPWQAGQRLVLFESEFPANVTPWLRTAELFGLRVDFMPMKDAIYDEDSFMRPLEHALRAGVRLVAVSAVQFQTGLCMPLARLAERCHAYGAELCVDGIQACGIVPLDVKALDIDYLVCGAHKWLLGMEGAGFLYAREDCARALVPRSAGWLSHEDAATFLFKGPGELRYDRAFKTGVPVFEGGSASTMSFAALEAGIEPILELTPQAIFAHVGQYLDELENGLVESGISSLRAREPERRSGILAVRPPPGLTAPELVAMLSARGVIASMPDGLVRFAPHFPNASAEVPRVLAAWRDAVAELELRSNTSKR